MNKKQKSLTNKGFSLVELIIVIAIMAVLVGVLAPQFIKYVEQSRKSTDIQNAEEIKSAVLADIADGEITGSNAMNFSKAGGSDKDATTGAITALGATTISEIPTIKGNLINHGGQFYVEWNATTGTCHVYSDSTKTYDLTDSVGAGNYKTDDTVPTP